MGKEPCLWQAYEDHNSIDQETKGTCGSSDSIDTNEVVQVSIIGWVVELQFFCFFMLLVVVPLLCFVLFGEVFIFLMMRMLS